MKIRFVGTGSISSLSNSASLLINDSILIDCGNGIHKALLRQNVDIKKIKYVFITNSCCLLLVYISSVFTFTYS